MLLFRFLLVVVCCWWFVLLGCVCCGLDLRFGFWVGFCVCVLGCAIAGMFGLVVV